MFAHELAAELERVLPDRVRQLVHEAFDEDGVLVDVHAAPEARQDVRIAHRVVDHQVRDGVAERVLLALRHEALERERIFPVDQVLREHVREDRLAGEPQVQSGQVVVLVERADELALHDRVIAPVRHVFFACPQQLHRRAGHFLGDENRLAHVVVERAAPAEPAACHVGLVDVAFVGRQA